jgi:pilus assembly protein CpaB
VITLLVSPDDAERLTLASSEGHIQLSLRNPLDTRQDEVDAARTAGLYKGALLPAKAVPHARTAKKKVETISPAPTVYGVEVYQGDKKPDVVKFPEQGEAPK